MEFSQVLAHRRMTRNYTEEPVDDLVLDRIAAAALRAPSAGNSQAIAVVVVTAPGTRASIANLADEQSYVAKGFDPWISGAPAHIVIAVSERIYRKRYGEPDKLGPDGNSIEWPIPYWWVDAGAALMAVLLAAVDEGLAAGFLGVHSVPDLGELLGFEEQYTPIGVVTVGNAAPDRRSSSLNRPKVTTAERVRRDRWL